MNLRNVAAGALDLLATGIAHIAARLAVAEWCIHITDDGTHTYPLRDGVAHEPSEDCVCGPTQHLETCDHDEPLWTYTHHPLTQRGDAP